MKSDFTIRKIAVIYNDYDSKFGVPRQSGIIEEESTVVFEPEFRIPEALRGLEEFNYLWLIWGFSENYAKPWSPTVRPPRLGGNKRVGVFATRSPFRPNSLGLSCVKLKEIVSTADNGIVLKVSGADIMSGSPVYDIKPYLKYADSREDAESGFSLSDTSPLLEVSISDDLLSLISPGKRDTLISVLGQDPRPQYITDEERVYGITFAGLNIRFTVENKTLTVVSVTET